MNRKMSPTKKLSQVVDEINNDKLVEKQLTEVFKRIKRSSDWRTKCTSQYHNIITAVDLQEAQ